MYDYIDCTIAELRAYEALAFESFNFGDGEIIPEKCEELTNYTHAIQQRESSIQNSTYPKKIVANKEKRRKRLKNTITKKQRYMYLSKVHFTLAMEQTDENGKSYYKRLYRSQQSKQIKKRCNKTVRYYKGDLDSYGNYKKLGEFWNELY